MDKTPSDLRNQEHPGWLTRPWVQIVGTLVLAGLIVLAAVVAADALGVDAEQFGESLVGSLLTLAGAAVITGVVGVWATRVRDRELGAEKQAQQRAEIEREHRAFLETQIVKLWDLHERVKTAAVLIAAHRTAKTYGEQMRAIIEVRTQLSDVSDTVKRRQEPLLGWDRYMQFREYLDQAAAYLHPLVDEYREHYLDEVSYRQRVDESINSRLDEKGDYAPARRSTTAWKALTETANFTALQSLIEAGRLDAAAFAEDEAWACVGLMRKYLKPLESAIGILDTSRGAEGPTRGAELT